jgi:hypothetical protein
MSKGFLYVGITFTASKEQFKNSILSSLAFSKQLARYYVARYYGVRLAEFATYSRDEIRFGHHLND